MGYRPPSKHYEMEFTDHPGLEVTARGASIGELLNMSTVDIKLNNPEEAKKVFEFFSSRVITWNVEHPEVSTMHGACPRCGMNEGQPLPSTVEGMLCLDMSFIMGIIFGWINHLMRVSVPKELNLNGGGPNLTDLTSQLAQLQSPPQLPTQS